MMRRLAALYQQFDVEERAMADQVIAEWILSEDEDTCFGGEGSATINLS
jgi:hypothetical protein